MLKHLVFVKDIDWDDDQHTMGAIEFLLNEKIYHAFGDCEEKIINRWINIEIDFREQLISNEIMMSENNEKQKIIIPASWYCGYRCYCQVVSIDPLIIDCGDIKFQIIPTIPSNIITLNKQENLNKYVYFVISRMDFLTYDLVE